MTLVARIQAIVLHNLTRAPALRHAGHVVVQVVSIRSGVIPEGHRDSVAAFVIGIGLTAPLGNMVCSSLERVRHIEK